MSSASLLALALLVGPTEDPRSDNPHFERAAQAYKEQRWREAADAFEDAYRYDPKPKYLFARAQALRYGGQCEDAIPVYETFVDREPPDEDVAKARENIDACRRELQVQPPPPRVASGPAPAPADSVVDSGGTSPVVDPQPDLGAAGPRRRWIRDPWGGTFTFGGLGVVGAGAAMLGVAHQRETRADDASSEEAYLDAINGAPALSRAGIVVLSVGAAAVIAGVIRYVWVATADRRRAPAAQARFRLRRR